MRLEKINLGEMGNYFSPIFLDYIEGEQKLRDYYAVSPNLSSFKSALENKTFSPEGRVLLQKVLNQQYKDFTLHEKVSENIALLKQENTFTVTTGHQLNIFSGPLYFIYKIVSTINCCKKLAQQYPDYNFVPVYWMATEDHDFEEINHFNLFGKTYRWETDQKGPVGRFKTAGIQGLIEELPEKAELFENAYKNNSTLALATRDYVNDLFGASGLVIIDGDSAELKGSFRNIVKDDLLLHNANSSVEKTSSELEELGYKSQVFPRKINFFYMEDGLRERIVEEEGAYKVLNTELSFTKEQILEVLEKSPEKFSPNVIMRPVYQEVILPNLAYFGGPGEIAYWLQLKPVFDSYEIPYPVIMPRNFALIINKTNGKKLNKLGLGLGQLFRPFQEIKQHFVESNSDQEFDLTKERERIVEIFAEIKERAVKTDKSLEGFVGAEENKVLKSIENISKRIQKGEEKSQEVAIKQIEGLKEKLFPEGNLQERTENLLNFYLNSPAIIDFLLECLDPFDIKFNVILEDDN